MPAPRPPFQVFFDEWQHVPAIWDEVRHLVDDDLMPGEDALMNGDSTPLVDAVRAVRDGGLFGALFESLVALSMRTYAQASDVEHMYVRTHGGDHEVDGLFVRRDQQCVAYEVKLAGKVTDDDVQPLHWLKKRLGDQLLDSVVVHTGPAAYRRADGIGVVPAAMLVP